MRVLEIVAGSWPIAVMFIAVGVFYTVNYVIRQHQRNEEADKAYRASMAVTVSNNRNPAPHEEHA
jgi:hypothetical protein